jgi:hypothetical protein
MRLPRYTAGRSNVSELESQRAASIKPGEAAQVQMAKYGAFADVAGATSGSLGVFDDVRRRQQAEAAKLTIAEAESGMNLASDAVLKDPERKEKYAEDDTHFQSALGEIRDALDAKLGEIQDEKMRGKAQQLADLRFAEMEQEFKFGEIDTFNELGADRAVIALDEAERNRDPSAMRTAIMAGDAFLSEPYKKQALARIEKMETSIAGEDLAEDVRQAYMNEGMDAGDDAYEVLLRNEDLADEVKDAALTFAAQHRKQFALALSDEIEAKKAENYRNATETDIAARQGLVSSELNQQRLENGDYGDPDTMEAQTHWGMVERTITTFSQKAQETLDVSAAVDARQILEPNAANREALQRDYEDRMEAGEIEPGSLEARALAADMTQATGVPPEAVRRELNSAAQRKPTPETFQQFALIMDGTTDHYINVKDEDGDMVKQLVRGTVPTLDLDRTADAVLKDIYYSTTYGTDVPAAIETAWENRTPKTPAEVTARQEQLEEIDREAMFVDSWEQIVPPKTTLFGLVTYKPDDTVRQAQLEWDAVFEESFMRSGNQLTAKAQADFALSQSWRPTNMESGDNDEYTLAKDPLVADASYIKRDVVAELNASGRGFRVRNAETGLPEDVETLNEEDVSFYQVVKNRDGSRDFLMAHNGIPFTFKGGGPVGMSMSADEANEYQRIERERIAKQEAVDTADLLVERYGKRVEKGTPNIYASPEQRAEYGTEQTALLESAKKRQAAARKALSEVPEAPTF